VVSFSKNRGKGAALIDGFSYVLREYSEADLVVTLDADGQHDPTDISRLIEAAKDGNSLVIGSRVEDPNEMPFLRRIANRAVSGFVSRLAGEQIADTQSGFRVFPARFIRERKFSQVRYGIETEMLFAAKSAGLVIREVPIKAVYFSKTPISWRKDLINLFDIVCLALTKGSRVALRRRNAWNGFALAAILATALIWQFNFSLDPLERDLVRGKAIFSKLAPDVDVQEKLAVFDWLQRNTPSDAIILAPRFEGHRIMALANRRAIVSSKVYPSESADVAARIRDTARFFFSTDDSEAIRILRQYRASYVLIPRTRDWFGLCREIFVCQWVSVHKNRTAKTIGAGDLTPEGARRTLVGKLLGKAKVPFLQKVWDSPSYLVYRVVEASAPARCELTDEERGSIARFIRSGGIADGGALDKPCGVSISIWSDGIKRYTGAAEGKTLRTGIRALLADFLGDPAKAEAIEIAVWDEDSEYPLSTAAFRSGALEPDHGYRLALNGKSTYAFPAFPASELTRNGSALPVDAKLVSFPADAFVDIRGALRRADFLRWSDETLRLRTKSALDWILRLQRHDGTFRNFMNPFDPDAVEPEPRDVALDALGAWALAEGYAEFPDPRYLVAARRGLARVEEELESGNAVRTNASSFALSGHLALWGATRDGGHREMARIHAERLRSLISKDLWVPERFLVSHGSARPVRGEYTRIATHVAFWALAHYYATLDTAVPDNVKALAEMLRKRFLMNRIVERNLNLAETARLANGFRAFATIPGEEEFSVVAETVGRWLVEFQYRDRPDVLDGAFPENPETSSVDTNSVGRVAEGLVFAGSDYRDEARMAFRWLMRMQYTPESLYFVPPNARSSLVGGLAANLSNRTAPIGAASHFAFSALWYLRQLKL
jgi:hypothetical protein